jgi:competence protein ComEC
LRYSDYPSLRLLIPFIGGILVYNTIGDTPVSLQQLFLLLTLLCFATMLFLFCGKRWAKFYGLLLLLSLFVSAYTLSQYQSEKVYVEWHADKRIYSGMLKDYPIEKAKSYRLDLELIDTIYGGKDIILYVPKDTLSKGLIPGSIISFNGQIKPPSNESIDGDFDYATYLYRNGVSGTLWVSKAHW